MTTATATHEPSYLLLGSCLLFAVSTCSSAGVVFDILTTTKEVPPFLAAFWRLLIQNTVQLVPFLWSLQNERRRDRESELRPHRDREAPRASALHGLKSPDAVRQAAADEGVELPLMRRYVRSLPLCGVSGIFLGTHFSMWVLSLRHTSLTHSLLWVSMGPIVINGGAWCLYFLGVAGTSVAAARRPATSETLGVLLGVAGAVIMLIGIKQVTVGDSSLVGEARPRASNPPTLYGDSAAFSGAVAVCAYLLIGQKLRQFIPVWLYVFPVVGAAALTCLVFAMLDAHDPATIYGYTNKSVLGFLSKDYFAYAVYLGIGPGILGHTLLNALLKHVSPLVVTTAMLMEPISGSIIGYMCGVQPLPDLSTWIGGGVLMVGLVLVVVGESKIRNEEVDVDAREKSEFITKPGGGQYGSTQIQC